MSILDWDDGEVEIAGWFSLTSDLEDEESDGKSSKLSIYGGVGLFVEDESTGLSWCFGGEHLNALNWIGVDVSTLLLLWHFLLCCNEEQPVS